MKQREAQNNSVAERRGWEQLSARKAADNESELDTACIAGEPASWGRSRAFAKADGMTTSKLHGKGWSQKQCGWLEIGCQPKWLRIRRETQKATETEFMLREEGSRRAERTGSQSVHSSASNAGTRGERSSSPARRRVTTAGVKGRRKMEAK